MTVRTRDWLKFGSLVAIAFVLGLAFASSLDLPKKGGAAEPLVAAQQTTAPPRSPLPAAKPIADLSEAFVAVAEHVKPAVVFIRSEKRERATDTRLPPGFGNSDSVRIGEWVLAIGNPLGENFTFTVTAGIVSAKGRLLGGLQQSRYSIQDFIQTDAAINPGNSGGPLVNVHGEVIGINSAIASETGFYTGYGFAIPINLARTVMQQLIKSGHVERAVMGVAIRPADPEDGDLVGLKEAKGVVVNDYSPDETHSPAKEAGIKPGDVIVALDGQAVEDGPQLQQRVGFKRPGETGQVTIVRKGGERKTVPVKLTRAPAEDEARVASNTRGRLGGEPGAKEEMLGVSGQPLTQDDARDPRLRPVMRDGGGLIVSEVSPDGPAYRRLLSADYDGGPDIIVAMNGTTTCTRQELRDALKDVKAGDIVTLQVLTRSGDTADGWAGRVVRLRAR